MRYLFIGTLLLALCACSLSNSSTTNEIGLSKKQQKEVAIIGNVDDKGGSLFSEDIYANSFESIVMALNKSKGAQVDIQISKDSTLWLFGEKKIRDCSHQEFKHLCEYDDGQIDFASICWYEKQLISLDSFIYKMKQSVFKDKIISLDLQSLSDPVALKHFGGEERLAEITAQKLAALSQLEGVKFLAELPSIEAIHAFEKQSNIMPYLRISEQGKIVDYSRLSLSVLRANEVEKRQVKAVQLWGANTADQLLEGIRSGAQIIQTTDLNMANFFQTSANLQATILAKDSLKKGASDTLFSVLLSEDQLKRDFLLQLTISEKANIDGANFHILGFNEEGHELFWEGVTIQKHKNTYLYFFSAEELDKKGCKQILVYIWRQNASDNNAGEFQLKQLVR